MENNNRFMLKAASAFTAALTLAGTAGTVSFAESAATGAPASDATPQPAGNFFSSPASWIPLLIYIAIFVALGYFLIFRPQKKRKQQEEQLRSSLMLGDEITTIGGICGRIVNIKDDNITIETSLDRTMMEFKNWAIRDVKKLVTDDKPDNAGKAENEKKDK